MFHLFGIRILSKPPVLRPSHSFGLWLLSHDSFFRCMRSGLISYPRYHTLLFWLTRRLHGIRILSKLRVPRQGHNSGFRLLFHGSFGRCILSVPTFFRTRHVSLFWPTRRSHDIRIPLWLGVLRSSRNFGFRLLFHDSFDRCISSRIVSPHARYRSLFYLTYRSRRIHIESASQVPRRDHSSRTWSLFPDSFDRCILSRLISYPRRQMLLFSLTRRLRRTRISLNSRVPRQDHNFRLSLLFRDSFGRYK